MLGMWPVELNFVKTIISTMTRLSLRLRSSPTVYKEIFQPYGDRSAEKLTLNLKEFIFFLRTEQVGCKVRFSFSEIIGLATGYRGK